MTLGDVAIGQPVAVEHVGGDRAFRRRLMELGLLPGTRVSIVRVAPLGDPIELSVRGCLLSIRREEARRIEVTSLSEPNRTGDTGVLVSVGPGVPAAP